MASPARATVAQEKSATRRAHVRLNCPRRVVRSLVVIHGSPRISAAATYPASPGHVPKAPSTLMRSVVVTAPDPSTSANWHALTSKCLTSTHNRGNHARENVTCKQAFHRAMLPFDICVLESKNTPSALAPEASCIYPIHKIGQCCCKTFKSVHACSRHSCSVSVSSQAVYSPTDRNPIISSSVGDNDAPPPPTPSAIADELLHSLPNWPRSSVRSVVTDLSPSVGPQSM